MERLVVLDRCPVEFDLYSRNNGQSLKVLISSKTGSGEDFGKGV